MDAILQLLSPGNSSLAATLVLYSFVIAAGIYLGKIKVAGVSLGVTFVLFVGILMGHFGYIVDGEVLKFIREFGLILFIFAIGLQVGPAFFSSFKKGGIRLNVLAVCMVALNVGIAVVIYLLNSDATSPAAIVGVLSGAVTNTPGLAAAQQAATQPGAADTMAMGYAAAYPLGVVGIIASILILRKVFRVNIADEIKKLEDEAAAEQQAPAKVSFEVTNERVNGLTLKQLHDVIHCDFVISRLLNAYNEVVIPTSQTKVHVGDKVKVIMSAQDELAFSAMLGPQIEMEWDDTPGQVVSRRIVLTQPKYNGMTLGQLHLHSAYQLNATRVNRGGVDLLASAGLRLQMGDRITVVGALNDIARLADKLGNSLR
ncbi:MAG: transporter, partial [Muribaculaceae bacterium]|nr:transporter [Muribaculaceae bacterium]